MNKIIEEKYNGITFKIEFLKSHNLRMYGIGKSWPITTQCIIYQNNRVIGLGEAVKHERDNDNPKYAETYAAKKAFKQTKLWKGIRALLWQKILTQ